MKITADRKSLSDVLTTVSSVVNARHTNPLLQNVMLDVADGALTLRATDLEVSLQYTMADAAAEKNGRALLPATKLAALVRDLRADTVTLAKKGDTVLVTCGRDKLELHSSDPDHFPAFPQFTGKGALDVDARAFGRCLARTGKSIATERGRYALNGVKMTPKKDMIEFCGTDGRRLSLSRMPGKGREIAYPIIMPRRGIDLMIRLLAEVEEGTPLALEINENEMLAKFGSVIASTALVDGQFPEYWTVIPTLNDKKVTVGRTELLEAVKLATHMTSVESSTVAMHLSDNEMVMKTRSSGTGTAEAVLEVQYDGPEFKAGFDPRYLTEGLNLFREDQVIMELKDSNTGVIIHEGDKETFFFLVMPLEV